MSKKPDKLSNLRLQSKPDFVIAETKTCNVCGETKPIKRFSKDGMNVDNRKNICMDCANGKVMKKRISKKADRDWSAQFSPV